MNCLVRFEKASIGNSPGSEFSKFFIKLSIWFSDNRIETVSTRLRISIKSISLLSILNFSQLDLELELEYIGEGLRFPEPTSRTNQYYVDITSNIGLQPNPKDALNITDIAKYTQFRFESDSLFIKTKTALSVYPNTRSALSGSRTTYTRYSR